MDTRRSLNRSTCESRRSGPPGSHPGRGPFGRYNDVLGLACCRDIVTPPLLPDAARGQLVGLGYSLQEPQPGHWIVELPDGPRRVHLYGMDELTVFIRRLNSKDGARAAAASVPVQ